ncbi:unnamed protein product [Larinioides sclopetarius]|uniref:Uncharacterized protein n=1 Tax=Larinioides sclopetarius TaxID=280406 RepID=A0AAV2B2W4_9ARAC
MEIDESLKFFSAYFCNEDKLLKYLIEFRNILQNTDHVIEFQKTENFLSCVIVLEKSCFFNSLDKNLQCISVLPDDFFENLNDVILSILEIFCFKYQKILLERQHNQDISRDVITSFDTIAYLVQLLISKIGNKGYISALLENMCCYFVESTKSMSHIYASSVESASNSLYYNTLKLLTKIIKSIPDNCYFKYISDTDILQLVNSLPFPDITTVKLFINHILPALFQFSSPSLKEEILKSMWNMVYAEFKKEDFKESSESSSYIYTMVYCVSAYIYNSNAIETVNFYVHTDIIFWQLILSGLTSSLPFVRKKSLNIFKMFLIWIKQCKKRVKVSNDVSLLPMDVEAIKIWNDVVTIFESLEEKQIHVIKPVLPKFSRILSLTTKGNFSTDENNARLISAWVLSVITRMLKHETKFVTRWALVTVLSFDFKEHILHEDSLKMLIKILLESFNDQSLFSKNSEQDNYSLFLSSEKISKFFKKYLAGLESPREKVAFFRYLLNIIASQSWCIVALLHITVALSTLESTASWNKSDISLIR